MTSVLQSLAHALEPWQSAYSNSKAISTAVTVVHIGAMLFAGGYALAADRAMLRAYHDRFAGERRGALEELAAVHRWVILGLVLLLLSGLLQAAADVNTYATSAVFWTKMVLVALLAVNGALLRSAEVRALSSA